ncbi:hypothetical protein T439DRAFT_335810 [Meredithblackwellia eburnea MCA 4105]
MNGDPRLDPYWYQPPPRRRRMSTHSGLPEVPPPAPTPPLYARTRGDPESSGAPRPPVSMNHLPILQRKDAQCHETQENRRGPGEHRLDHAATPIRLTHTAGGTIATSYGQPYGFLMGRNVVGTVTVDATPTTLNGRKGLVETEPKILSCLWNDPLPPLPGDRMYQQLELAKQAGLQFIKICSPESFLNSKVEVQIIRVASDEEHKCFPTLEIFFNPRDGEVPPLLQKKNTILTPEENATTGILFREYLNNEGCDKHKALGSWCSHTTSLPVEFRYQTNEWRMAGGRSMRGVDITFVFWKPNVVIIDSPVFSHPLHVHTNPTLTYPKSEVMIQWETADLHPDLPKAAPFDLLHNCLTRGQILTLTYHDYTSCSFFFTVRGDEPTVLWKNKTDGFEYDRIPGLVHPVNLDINGLWKPIGTSIVHVDFNIPISLWNKGLLVSGVYARDTNTKWLLRDVYLTFSLVVFKPKPILNLDLS